MINTREQVLANYKDLETKGKSGVKVYDQDELICTYQTKKGTVKAVFFTDELNMEKFRVFARQRMPSMLRKLLSIASMPMFFALESWKSH